jgi:hypothetical protein
MWSITKSFHPSPVKVPNVSPHKKAKPRFQSQADLTAGKRWRRLLLMMLHGGMKSIHLKT